MREAYEANPDGCGVLYEGVKHFKGCWGFESLWSTVRMVEYFGFEFIIHLRTASSGSISKENCHPFYVNKDLAFVENGNFYEYSDYFGDGYGDDKTDVRRFNDSVLKKLPENFLYIPEIRSALECYCKSNLVKMIFMDKNGVEIINEDAGEWTDGCWYSNGGIKNYIGYGYSGAYYYKNGDTRHRGGLFSVQMLPEEKRKHWSRCDKCLGYYRNIDKTCYGCLGCEKLLSFTGGR